MLPGPEFLPIDRDVRRFRDIVRGKVRKNLRKFIKDDALIGKRGDHLVSVPVPEIELPRFRHGQPEHGVGQGEGKPGDVLGRKGDQAGDGNKGGDQPGQHILEVELTLDELAEMLGEELALPRIQPKRKANVTGQVDRYTSLRRVGPESLRQFRRTYLTALKRMVANGEYDPDDPRVVPIPDDKRYRSWKTYPVPESNAVVLYGRDVSGSMDRDKTRLVRLIAFWIDTWLKFQYKRVITRYIVHDMSAAEVDMDTFFHLHVDGGTHISAMYAKALEILEHDYQPADWNTYLFQFTDGENFDYDNDRAVELVRDRLLKHLNLMCYGQVMPKTYFYGPSSTFMDLLKPLGAENMLLAQIDSDEDIYRAIKTFLGKGL